MLALAGFVLIVWGYGLARQEPVVLWSPPVATRHVASLLTLFAFVLLFAAYVPRNAIKAKLKHPMVLAVKVWAFAHLLSNGTLLWAVLDFRSARGRDRAAGTAYPPGTMAGTAGAVVVGIAAWLAFALWLHAAWIGVAPFGR